MTIAAVILAAGGARRFGSAKVATRIGSRSMMQVVADTAVAAGLSPVIVVAPSALDVPDVALAVRNDAPEMGMSRSLRLGIATVPPDAEAAVILLADQPTVDVAHLRRLLAARGATPVVATRASDALGPPAVLERDAFGLAESVGGDAGMRDLLRTDPTLVTAVEQAALPDVDTPEDLEAITEPCPGCAARFLPQVADDTHPYIGASAACWSAFGELLAREFGDPGFGRVHRHSVDVYAAQHPGGDDRRQRQSVALHLVGLCHWLEHDLALEALNRVTARLAGLDRAWPWLEPPAAYALTVTDVLAARDAAAYVDLVRRWGQATWAAWAPHHDAVRAWAAEALRDER